MHSQTHATLLDRLREASDPLAWEEFYERYWRLIYATARGRGCSDHTAEEIVQEAMLAVFKGRGAIPFGTRFAHLKAGNSDKLRRVARWPAGRYRACHGWTHEA